MKRYTKNRPQEQTKQMRQFPSAIFFEDKRVVLTQEAILKVKTLRGYWASQRMILPWDEAKDNTGYYS